VTLFYALFDASRRRLRCANAGHLPPLVWRARVGEVARIECSGLVLGVEPTAEYEEEAAALGPGDAMLLYSDGVVEARGHADVLEIEGLARLFAHTMRRSDGAEASCHAAVETLFASVLRHASETLHDDATLLLLRPTVEVAGSPAGAPALEGAAA
jgi:sigma-B regulation protein RsbU (phosphoserine phosphatase)